jgi:S-formylglutathione hydrolase FrmB
MKLKLYVVGLLLMAVSAVSAATVENVSVESASMHKSVPNVVVLPEGYSSVKTYPTVYLLHGATGNQSDWIRMVPGIRTLSDQYQVVIVCPDGGVTSWYFDSPVDSTYRYETYVTKELISYVDSHYSTVKDKSGRAITGLSMGGHGGLYLSIRHQDLFGAGGSMSGGVDIRPFPNNWDIAKRLGTIQQNPQNWERYTVTNMLDLLKGSSLKIIFDCGVDDFFYTVNAELHRKLVQMKYPHDYTERPGVHNWPYWANAVKYQFLFFNDFFQQAKPKS